MKGLMAILTLIILFFIPIDPTKASENEKTGEHGILGWEIYPTGGEREAIKATDNWQAAFVYYEQDIEFRVVFDSMFIKVGEATAFEPPYNIISKWLLLGTLTYPDTAIYRSTTNKMVTEEE